MIVEPLSEALGAEISGVDWSRVFDQSTIERTKAALLRYHLVCLRSDRLSAAAYANLATFFGEPQLQLLRNARDPIVPVVSVFDSTYKNAEAKPANLQLDRRSGWHTDDSYFAIPAKITLLQALTIPSAGGETRFCNAGAAYEDLDEADKAAFAPLRAVHSYDTARAPARAAARKPEEEADTTDVIHPLIRTHEESGAKAIYFNSNRTDRIVGLSRHESDALLDRIHAHMTQKKYQYHHGWRLGDILMWDNRSVTHSVNMDFPVGEARIHQRILLRGKKPV
ncbi:MAG: TauD/TfdA family dioxygenase [Proteobacteria bacterium]|nr:TauD/TfdA family dioxygenase [Pseudomonadota bacterium]